MLIRALFFSVFSAWILGCAQPLPGGAMGIGGNQTDESRSNAGAVYLY